jgi:hypothetical protein
MRFQHPENFVLRIQQEQICAAARQFSDQQQRALLSGYPQTHDAIAAPLLETDEAAAFEMCAEELAEVRGARRVQRAATEEMNPTHVGIG